MSCISLAFHTPHVVATGRVDKFNPSTAFNRSSFPKIFVFGTAGASYQYEGAYNVDRKGPSIWDTFTHHHPEKIADGSNGDVANDQYHRYKEDVALLNDMGMDAYRFSISWSRILPKGKVSKGVNKKGIKYYNHLIDELLSKGLQPFVTLFHWDVPQSLEQEYRGFLCERIISDFQDYAELCYNEFGDRVKYWITLNEPAMFSSGGYDSGIYAPGRCSTCWVGDSAREPYITAHNQLLAHAAAVQVYKQKYQAQQNGKIGITLNSDWIVPSSYSTMDKVAAQRAIDFQFGWFMDPLTYGHYPESVQSVLVERKLPNFSREQSDMVKGSYDFLGLNYYTGNYATYSPPPNDAQPSYTTDSHANLSIHDGNGTPIGPPAAPSWLSVYPSGFYELLLYIKDRYKNLIIYITENGVAEFNNSTLSLKEALIDNMRIYYHYQHLTSLLKAKEEGVDARGYFVWSFLDTFEWNTGYTVRFGLIYVDYKTMIRYPKHSAIWFQKFLLH